MPCMYFIHCEFGALGSFFLRYKYSCICRQTPILYFFETVKLEQTVYTLSLFNAGFTPSDWDYLWSSNKTIAVISNEALLGQ